MITSRLVTCRLFTVRRAMGLSLRKASSHETEEYEEKKGKSTLGINNEYRFRTAQEEVRKRQQNGTTFNEDEVDKFRRLAQTWWDPDGNFKALHSMNRLRVELVREGLIQTRQVRGEECPKMLEGIRILDVGCGGGILTEALARLGAKVTGLDAAEENIKIARTHAEQDPEIVSNINYVCSTVEEYAALAKDKFHAVVASEVIEHVDNQELFVKTCASLVPVNGSLFFTTLNRSKSSYLAGIVAAEYLLGLLPVGTHDWDKFVKPEELDQMLSESGCQTRLVHGMFYWPVFNQWSWIPQANVNYATHAIKIKECD